MKKVALLAALALTPVAASAGVGTTGALGTELSSTDNAWGGNWVRGAFWPTLDYRGDPVIVQIHVLEFLAALAQEDVFLGANIHLDLIEGAAMGQARGVIQPGVSVDILGDPFVLALGATGRFGFETGSNVNVGAYIGPVLGLAFDDGDVGLLTGGSVQFSFWVGGKGSGSGVSSAPPRSSSPPPPPPSEPVEPF
jgi:hypothetical protein